MTARISRILDRAQTRLKMRQLRLLVAVGRHRNILNAARELGISQPAATKMIQDLEQDFEVKLFQRTNRGVVPTIFGDALFRHGNLIFSQLFNAIQELDELGDGNIGRVVVGSLIATTPVLLPTAVDILLEERPKVTVKIVTGFNEVLMPALLAGEVDMVVGRLPLHRHREGITQEILYDHRILAIVGNLHPLANKKAVSFEQTSSFGWILPPVETTLRRQIDEFFLNQSQFEPRLMIETTSYLFTREYLRSHDLISFIPAHIVSRELDDGLLNELDLNVPFGKGSIGISYRSADSLTPAGQAFMQALRDAAERISLSGPSDG